MLAVVFESALVWFAVDPDVVCDCCMLAAAAADALSEPATVLLLDSRLGLSLRCSEVKAGMALLLRMCSALILSALAVSGGA